MNATTPAERAPGLVILGLVALGSALVAGPIPAVNALVLAVAFGVLFTNSVGVPSALNPGIALHSLLLETAIVLLGASLSLDILVVAGSRVVLLVVATVAAGLLAVTFAARTVGLTSKVGAILAAGASVCGVAAVVAAADVLDAEDSEVAPVLATVLLFDAVTLLAVPAIAIVLDLPVRQLGVWAGLTMFSTGPVMAAGFVYGPVAGQWAAFTKLVRNSLVGAVALAYTAAYVDREEASLGQLWTAFPKVLVGFLVVVLVANSGLLTAASRDLLSVITDWLFLLAFAGLGFELRVERMRGAGRTLVALVFVHLVVIGVLALVAIVALGL